MTVESAAQGLDEATPAQMMGAAWNLMNQIVPLAVECQKPMGHIVLANGQDPRELRIEALSQLTVALTSCLNMVMVAMAKESEIKSLPRAERRRRSN